ncbi:hypothetical protein L208DRAFT_1463285 [Tricholoma matsutake]|nr:hypothetical protein L208DRAFT_1463285 [Tricholoma matsutake 945]
MRMAFFLFQISLLVLASLKVLFIMFYGSGKRLATLFHINMATRLDAFIYFILMMFSISYISNIDLTGFWMSSSNSWNEIALYLFTILPSIGSWNMLECPTKSSRLLPRNVMNHLEMIICGTWQCTAQNSLDFLMRLPRMTKLLKVY